VTGFRPVLDKHFPLEQLGAAFAHQESGTHFGKIIVDI
jgi:NADPH:quinone reductase-like Zn-dependent oxidoreductase